MSDRKSDSKSDVQHLDYNNQTDSASSFVYEEGTDAERRLLRKIDIVSSTAIQLLLPSFWEDGEGLGRGNFKLELLMWGFHFVEDVTSSLGDLLFKLHVSLSIH